MAGGLHGGEPVWQQDVCGKGVVHGGACVTGGMHGKRACVAGEMATAADGTHPTGMHSFKHNYVN